MTKKRNFLAFLLTILVLSIALSGCGGGKTEKNSSTAPSDDSSSSGEPTYGGSVVVGITQDLDSLDPHKAVAAGTKEVLFNIFEGLVKPNKNGDLVPAVASDYKMSKDGKTYTFTLRKGIKFHNGKLVTVEDIVYSIKRSAGLLKTTDSTVVVEPALTNISDVKAVNDQTVEILLKNADTELLGYLTCAIIPKDYKDQATKPIGTGPFQFVSYKPLESLVLKKNKEYWDEGKPYLDGVTFKISSNTDSAFMELQSGGIDIFPYLTDNQAKQLSDQFRIAVGNMNLVQGLFLNNGTEPFNNPKVREALNYAIDKQGIIDMVAGGKGTIIGSNMFPGFKKYYDGKLASYYSYNVEKAKQLLAQAGYANGLEFTITVPSNYQFHVDTTQVIVEQLKAVGITAKIQQIEWSAWLSDVYAKHNYQATVIGLDSKLAARNTLERYNTKASGNFINYSNPEFDKTFAQAIAETDETAKIADYKKLQKILTEDSASVYIQDPALLVAVNKKLGGYTFYPVYVQAMEDVYFKK